MSVYPTYQWIKWAKLCRCKENAPKLCPLLFLEIVYYWQLNKDQHFKFLSPFSNDSKSSFVFRLSWITCKKRTVPWLGSGIPCTAEAAYWSSWWSPETTSPCSPPGNPWCSLAVPAPLSGKHISSMGGELGCYTNSMSHTKPPTPHHCMSNH